MVLLVAAPAEHIKAVKAGLRVLLEINLFVVRTKFIL